MGWALATRGETWKHLGNEQPLTFTHTPVICFVMMSTKLKIPEHCKVNSGGSPSLAGGSSGRAAGWVVRQNTASCVEGWDRTWPSEKGF